MPGQSVFDASQGDPVIAWRGSRPVLRSQFMAQAQALSALLPDAPAALNLCEDRYRFMLAFVALSLRGQRNLLPPNVAPAVIAQITQAHPGCILLGDRPMAELGLTVQVFEEPIEPVLPSMPAPADDAVVAIAYTSGSTGTPQPHAKTWGALLRHAQLAADCLFGPGTAVNIVATVPPQHMYGLELSVTMALAAGCRTSAGKPFFPQDIAAALAALPEPRALVTTPLHLRACLAAAVRLPPLFAIVSATAALSAETAAEVEKRFGAPVHEIYGCTEGGSLASRRTAVDEVWQLHPGLSLARDTGSEDGLRVRAEHLSAPVLLQDRLEVIDAQHFRLLGRAGDLVKVAGKRASLAELTSRLLEIPGVEDAVVFLPPSKAGGDPDPRPAALVVAPTLDRARILSALAESIDAVLLPRPLLQVDRLPRNELGKLSRAALLEALAAAGGAHNGR